MKLTTMKTNFNLRGMKRVRQPQWGVDPSTAHDYECPANHCGIVTLNIEVDVEDFTADDLERIHEMLKNSDGLRDSLHAWAKGRITLPPPQDPPARNSIMVETGRLTYGQASEARQAAVRDYHSKTRFRIIQVDGDAAVRTQKKGKKK